MFPLLFQNTLFPIYSYPLFVGIAWGIAYRLSEALLIRSNHKTEGLPLFYLLIFISSWFGAKIFFLLATKNLPDGTVTNSNFWLGGGFVFLGGLIAALLVAALYVMYSKIFRLEKALIILPTLPIAHAIGRVGCFLAGCCYGKESSGPLAIYMHEHYRYPVQIYEVLGLLIIGYLMLKRSKDSLMIYLISYSCLRFGLEFIRGDLERGHFGYFSTSQWLSLVTAAIGALLLLYKSQKSKQLPL